MGLRNQPPEDVAGKTASPEPIRHTLTVRLDSQRAFELFTAQMGKWWPVEAYSRAVSEFASEGLHVTELEFQPRLGGAVLEHTSDGRTLPWAEVIVWDPPRRVILAWRPHSLPEPPTELEVQFVDGDDGTSIDLEHRGWERLSEPFRAVLQEIYVRGWPTTLDRFVAAANNTPQET